MAISVVTQPSEPMPVYEPMYVQVTSTNYLQPQFRFVFDIYKNGVFTERIKAVPKMGTNAAYFSPSRILESYLSYDITAYYTSLPLTQTNSMLHYTIQYGEEYGPTTAAPVVYTNLASSSGFTWNGNSQIENYYQSYLGSYATNFILKFPFNDNQGRFLTNCPDTLYVNEADRHSLSAFNFRSTDVSDNSVLLANGMEVVTWQMSGGSTTSLAYFPGNSGTTISDRLFHFGVGPANINGISAGYWFSGPTSNIVDWDRDLYYTVRLINVTAGPVYNVALTQYKTFYPQPCSKYDNVRIMWLNRLGGWDFYNFDKVSRETINSTKNTIKKNLPIELWYGTTINSRETTVIDSTNTKTGKLTSNWVTDEESAWLEELWTSPEVFIINTDNPLYYLTPIVITTTQQEIKKRVNDQIFNYEFEYIEASEVNVQRA